MCNEPIDQRADNRLPEVGVIILTKERRDLLFRALASISRQKYTGIIKVLIVGDECSYLDSSISESVSLRLDWHWVNITGDLFKGAPTIKRIASLRNLALSQIRTELVTFLDDDNQWSPDHLCTLQALMADTGHDAVHSWRVLVDEFDRPVIVDSFPWLRDRTEAVKLFEIMVELGLMSDTSPIVRDRHEAIHDGRDFGMIDCGEWLFRRSLLDSIGFHTDFSRNEVINMIGEDDKLLMDLKRMGVPIACTEAPTLFYTLGGMSNNYFGNAVR